MSASEAGRARLASRALGFLRLGEIIAGLPLGDVVPATPYALSARPSRNVATFGPCPACKRLARLEGPLWVPCLNALRQPAFASWWTCGACGSTRAQGPELCPENDL